MTALAVWSLLGWLGLAVIATAFVMFGAGGFIDEIERAHRGHW